MREAKDVEVVSLAFPDVRLREVPVAIGERSYVLVEATEEDVTLYENTTARGVKFSAKGKPSGLDRTAEGRSVLLASCLKEVRSDGTHGQVAEAFVRSLPSRVTKALFKTLKDMSGIEDAKDEDEPRDERGLLDKIEQLQAEIDKLHAAKNGQGATLAITA